MSFVQENFFAGAARAAKWCILGGKRVKILSVMTRVERDRVTSPFGLSLIFLLKIKLIHMYFLHTGQKYT